jgi:hypothetical protein|tara:strand:- start:198 stop:380 length:183 start_codon:yes stop_codon:yes gene_type:complete
MRLHEQVKHQKEIIEAYQIGISEITSYLESSKFKTDVYVNKGDMFLKISELKYRLLIIGV